MSRNGDTLDSDLPGQGVPDDFRRGFLALTGVAGVANVALPFVGNFVAMSPPLFVEVSWLVGFSAPMLALIGFYLAGPRVHNPAGTGVRRRFVWAAAFLVGSLIAAVAYVLLLSACTVTNPQTEERWQTGFGKAEFTLTDEGKRLLSRVPTKTATDWMLITGNFKPGGPAQIWHQWSISLAGGLLIALYLVTFTLFTASWSVIARQLYEMGQPNTPVATGDGGIEPPARDTSSQSGTPDAQLSS